MLAHTNDRVNKNDKKGGCEEIKINFPAARDQGVKFFTPPFTFPASTSFP